MAKTRIRKPGAGRKPAGPISGKVSSFTTRITAETRAALEAEAANSSRSLSQSAEEMLISGLKQRRAKRLPDPIRALAHLLGRLDELTWSPAEDSTHCHWHNDPSVFKAFQIATMMLLDRLKPAGEVDTSVEGPLVGRSPEQHAESAFRQLWAAISIKPMSSTDVRHAFGRAGGSLPREALADLSNSTYEMADVRRDLNIQIEGGEK